MVQLQRTSPNRRQRTRTSDAVEGAIVLASLMHDMMIPMHFPLLSLSLYQTPLKHSFLTLEIFLKAGNVARFIIWASKTEKNHPRLGNFMRRGCRDPGSPHCKQPTLQKGRIGNYFLFPPRPLFPPPSKYNHDMEHIIIL